MVQIHLCETSRPQDFVAGSVAKRPQLCIELDLSKSKEVDL